MSSCSLSIKICCMQPWKRFSLVSHFLIVLLVCGQPEHKKANVVEVQIGAGKHFVVNHLTSKKVAIPSPDCEGIGDP